MVDASRPAPRGFNCGNCGAAVELRALRHTRSVACTSCAAILDPRDPNVVVLQTAAEKESIAPEIPLGSSGTWQNQKHQVIGFQRRSIEADGTRYSWDEYVLFNPYRGFRYLSQYQGHWNDIRTVRELPEPISAGRRPEMKYRGKTYRHFQTATARTDFVLGEFPWRVRVGDEVEAVDFIAPPHLLSGERTDDETTWSTGVYTDPAALWRAFSVQGSPPRPIGVFANQPNPMVGRARFVAFLALAAMLLVLLLTRLATADRERVFSGEYVHQPDVADSAFVTDTFRLRDPGTVEIGLSATLTNAWLGFDLALVNVESGTALNVRPELSYFAGVDSDGPWSEGDPRGRVLLPQVPAGEYYLRVEADSEGTALPVPYTIRVNRDVPSLLPYGIAFILLMVPPVAATMSRVSFEHRRFQESDHGG